MIGVNFAIGIWQKCADALFGVLRIQMAPHWQTEALVSRR